MNLSPSDIYAYAHPSICELRVELCHRDEPGRTSTNEDKLTHYPSVMPTVFGDWCWERVPPSH